MEYSAIIHYAEKKYCYAYEKNGICIRIQVKKGDMKRVVLHCQEKYIPVSFMDTRNSMEMTLLSSTEYSDIYEARFSCQVVCLRYFFELTDREGETRYYGNHAFYEEEITDVDRMFDYPQTLREEESFHTPDWAKNKVVYQIFPARFATDQEIDPEVWYQAPVHHDTDLKGNLRGIINHLGYLKDLGVDILYLTPIFQSSSTHKYNIEDYYKIDPGFGTKEDLQELVDKAHNLGLRVILDGVFNHTSIDFFAFRDIREKEAASSYLNWYYIENFPLQLEWGQRPNFKCFSYANKMPKLNLSNPDTADYFIQVAKYWIRECHIDGWRLDVADEIGHAFWRRFRREVKEEFPETLIVGEIWHYAGDFLEGDQWDSVMNYHFYRSVLDLVVENRISVSQFAGQLSFMKGNVHEEVYPVLWNLIDSHDTARFLHSCGGDKGKLRLAAALQLLLPGMPMLYYGDEVGMEGGPDPDCRRGMLWEESRQDGAMLAWYQTLLRLRREERSLTEGRLSRIDTDDEQGLLIIEREDSSENAQRKIVFHCKKGSVKLPQYEGLQDLITGDAFSGELGDYQVAVLK